MTTKGRGDGAGRLGGVRVVTSPFPGPSSGDRMGWQRTKRSAAKRISTQKKRQLVSFAAISPSEMLSSDHRYVY
jgi:hypothetical protein